MQVIRSEREKETKKHKNCSFFVSRKLSADSCSQEKRGNKNAWTILCTHQFFYSLSMHPRDSPKLLPWYKIRKRLRRPRLHIFGRRDKDGTLNAVGGNESANIFCPKCQKIGASQFIVWHIHTYYVYSSGDYNDSPQCQNLAIDTHFITWYVYVLL